MLNRQVVYNELGFAQTAKRSLLFVSGLDEAVDERSLLGAFQTFGDVVRVELPRDSSSSFELYGEAVI